MSYVTIKFESRPGTIQFNRKYLSEYPYSIIPGHTEVFPESNQMTLDIDYNDFKAIYQVVRRKKDLWSLPKNLFELAHKMGLVNDVMCEIDGVLSDTYHKTRETVEKILATSGSTLMSNTIDEYLKMKQIFMRNTVIVPFQIIARDDIIEIINIYEGIPIWIAGSIYSCDANDREHVVTIYPNTNVNEIRYNMLPIISDMPDDSKMRIFDASIFVYFEAVMEFVVSQNFL